MVAAVRLRNVAIGVAQAPLSDDGAGVVARRHRRIHAELCHQSLDDALVVEVAADAELLHLEFVGAAALGSADERVIDGVREVEDIAGIGPELPGEGLAVEGRFLGARVAIQPGEIGESEGLRRGEHEETEDRVHRAPPGQACTECTHRARACRARAALILYPPAAARAVQTDRNGVPPGLRFAIRGGVKSRIGRQKGVRAGRHGLCTPGGHARPDPRPGRGGLLRRLLGVRALLRAARGRAMTLEYAIGLALAVLLPAYLAYALLKPEKF